MLTITGYRLNTVRELTNIDKLFDWGVIWGERRKAAAMNTASVNGHHFNGNGSSYSVDEIEQIVRNGAPEGANRSNTFHTIVGHYVGCGWDVARILEHLQQFPHGIGERYIREDRLHNEIDRSARKFKKVELPSSGAAWSNGLRLRRHHHRNWSLRKKMTRSLKRIRILTTIAISMKISTGMI